MGKMIEDDKDTLEKIIDAHTLGWVLATLADICCEKAAHIRTNGQDTDLASAWDRAGKKIDRITTVVTRLVI